MEDTSGKSGRCTSSSVQKEMKRVKFEAQLFLSILYYCQLFRGWCFLLCPKKIVNLITTTYLIPIFKVPSTRVKNI